MLTKVNKIMIDDIYNLLKKQKTHISEDIWAFPN
jgi:hypothetical protein